jgi:hypothetical protein
MPSTAQNQLFDADALAVLREEYSKINTIDPCSPSYNRLCETLDRMGDQVLQQVAAANIKFMSMLAANRVSRRTTARLEQQAALDSYERGME